MLRKLLLFFVYNTLIITCFGQLSKIESKEDALSALKKTISDSNRQYLYNFLGTIYLGNAQTDKKMFDSAFYYLRKAVNLGDSVNLQNKEITVESLSLLAQAYLWSGNVSTWKQIYLHVIANYRTDQQKTKEPITWRRMGRKSELQDITFGNVPAYFDSASALLEQEKNLIAKAEVMLDKMDFFIRIGNTIEADKEQQKIAVEAKRNNFQYLSQIYLMLSMENRYYGNLNKALQFVSEAIKYLNYAKNKTDVHNYYGEFAQVYEDLGEAEKSIFWYKKCIAERENNGYPLWAYYRTISLYVIQLIKVKKEKEAIVVLQQLANRRPPISHREKGSLLQSFGYCYTALKQYKLAEIKFLGMISEYNQGESEQEFLHIAYYDIGKFYVDFNQYAKAGFYLTKAIKFGSSTISREKDLNFLMFKVDSARGELISAIKHFQRYKALNDSIFTKAKTQQINELMIGYETEKKDNNIKTLEKEKLFQDGQLVQANQIRNWIMGVAILLLIITGLLINNSRVKQHANKKLKVQQKEIQAKNTSLEHLVKEKEWLVKEIHHRVKNNLHTIIGLLHTQSGFLKTEEALLAINESQHRIQAMSLIHEKLFQSGDLSTIEMSRYIRELADYLQHSFNTGQRIQFKLDTEELELKLSHSLPIGLILNEAITNAIKYAFPTNSAGIISVTLRHIQGLQYKLTIADNGKGLPEGFDFKKSSTMGMNLMEGLSEDMQGSFSIKNDNGTAITVLFLYDASVADDLLIQQSDV